MTGEKFSVSQAPEISVKLIGTAPFAEVHIIKDNRARSSRRKGQTSFYYVRGQQSDGGMVSASPMRITRK